jgi:hypothetical protein
MHVVSDSARISFSELCLNSSNLLSIVEHVLRSIPSVSSYRAIDRSTGRVLVAANGIDHDSVKKLIEQLARNE